MGAARCKVFASTERVTVSALLEKFKSPTEKSMRTPPPPKSREIKSLRVMKTLKSPQEQAKDIVKPFHETVIDMRQDIPPHTSMVEYP